MSTQVRTTLVIRVALVAIVAGSLSLLGSTRARADVPADYKGKPFDPALAGGAGVIPATVTAGPYAIPGRIDFANYDLGGEQVAYHAGDHITSKNGNGYRTDLPTATFSLTAQSKPDIWYDSGTAMDGMFYPSATSADFYIGAVQVNDYFNFTVDVKTAGTYSLSSTWSSGNGPPGGEGGDGAMGLDVYSNGTKLATWTASFPDFNDKANFHNWKPYPNFTTVTLQAGLQVIKLLCTSKHLNLDYVQFDLLGADGGTTTTPDAGTTTDAGATGAAGSGAAGATGAAGVTGAAGTPGGTAGATGGAGVAGDGAGGSSSVGEAGAPGAAGTGAAGSGSKAKSSGGCSIAASSRAPAGGALAASAMMIAVGMLGRRRRRR
jgi:hypothetical protein